MMDAPKNYLAASQNVMDMLYTLMAVSEEEFRYIHVGQGMNPIFRIW